MNDTDDRIREALRAEDQDLFKGYHEPSLLSQALTTMRRGTRWANALAFGFTFVFFGLAVWTAIEFFRATETQAMIAWAIGFLFCMQAVAMLKMWFWMQMDKYVVLREVKRLELAIARLTQRLDS